MPHLVFISPTTNQDPHFTVRRCRLGELQLVSEPGLEPSLLILGQTLLHWTDEDTEAQRGKGTSSMPHSRLAAGQDYNPGFPLLSLGLFLYVCVCTEWDEPAGKCEVSHLQQGLLCPSAPAILGCQAGVPDEPVLGAPGKGRRVPSCECGNGPRTTAASAKGLGVFNLPGMLPEC